MTETIDLFREHVLGDPALQLRLRGLGGKDEFVARVVELAAEAGFDLTPDQVEAALNQARREWLERWI